MPAPHRIPPVWQPGYFPVPGSAPNAPTQAIPVVPQYQAPQYQAPAWGDTWQQPPRAGRGGLLAGGLALLVAALVTGVVIFTQGGSSDPLAQPGSGGQTQLPPVPAPTTDRRSVDPITTVPGTSDPVTTVPIATAPETTAPDTTAPNTTIPGSTIPETSVPVTTSKPDTSRPSTSGPATSRPTPDPRIKDKQAAEQVAAAWADAVSAGDFDGVLAVSCDQDLQAYDSGELENPATLAGRFTLTFDRVIVSPPYGVAYFTIDPAVDDETGLTSFVTAGSGQWKVCLTVTDPEDL